MDPEIKVTSVSLVQAADSKLVQELGEQFPLGPIDSTIAVAFPIPVCFVYETSIDIPRLRHALEHLLNHYPHLTGRLRADRNDIRHLDRFGTGAEFRLATCAGTIADAKDDRGRIDLSRLPDGGRDLLPTYDPDDFEQNPLLCVQVTTFQDGTVLGMRLAHAVTDGVGFFLFAKHLAEMYNTGQIRLPSVIRPHFPSSGPGDFVPSMHAIMPHRANKCGWRQGRDAAVGRYIHLDQAYLDALKERATPLGGRISTWTAVIAHVYLVLHRARRLAYPERANAGSDLASAANIRTVTPDYPANYFGNAIFAPYLRHDADSLTHADLRDVAASVNALTRSSGPACVGTAMSGHFDPAQVEDTVRWLHAQPDQSRIRTGVVGDGGSLIATQWSKLVDYPRYALDESEPVFVGPSPHLMVDGLLLSLPPVTTEANDGGLLLVLAWTAAVWQVVDRYNLLDVGAIEDKGRLEIPIARAEI